MLETQPQQIPTLMWLLQSEGLAPLALGLFLAVVGIGCIIRPNRTAIMLLTLMALLPAVFGMVLVYSAAADHSEMALSPDAPKPAEFASITARAMRSSFCSLIGTIIPVVVAVLAQSRANSREE